MRENVLYGIGVDTAGRVHNVSKSDECLAKLIDYTCETLQWLF